MQYSALSPAGINSCVPQTFGALESRAVIVFKVDSAHEKCITDAECSLMTVQYSGKRFLSPYVCERVLVLSELCDSDTFCPVSLCSVIHHSGHQVSSLQLKLDSAEQEVVGLRVRVSVVSTFYCE